MSDKPREYWLALGHDETHVFAREPKNPNVKDFEHIHVIEYSAYERAKSDDAKTQKALDSVLELNKALYEERDEARARAAKVESLAYDNISRATPVGYKGEK